VSVSVSGAKSVLILFNVLLFLGESRSKINVVSSRA